MGGTGITWIWWEVRELPGAGGNYGNYPELVGGIGISWSCWEIQELPGGGGRYGISWSLWKIGN